MNKYDNHIVYKANPNLLLKVNADHMWGYGLDPFIRRKRLKDSVKLIQSWHDVGIKNTTETTFSDLKSQLQSERSGWSGQRLV